MMRQNRLVRSLGIVAAFAIFGIDQADKYYMQTVFFANNTPPVKMGPFLDLVMAWNPGISYSLLSAHTPMGRSLLLALTLGATLALAVWLYFARKPIVALGIGLLIGGALGNALDRFRFGAVADFFYFHIGGFSWYIFNLADCGIVIGVGVLLWDSLIVGESTLKN